MPDAACGGQPDQLFTIPRRQSIVGQGDFGGCAAVRVADASGEWGLDPARARDYVPVTVIHDT
jgi:hypothetical protein